ncbi:hypothetical protein Tco_1573265, partial [Tanacetum coccineum]
LETWSALSIFFLHATSSGSPKIFLLASVLASSTWASCCRIMCSRRWHKQGGSATKGKVEVEEFFLDDLVNGSAVFLDGLAYGPAVFLDSLADGPAVFEGPAEDGAAEEVA